MKILSISTIAVAMLLMTMPAHAQDGQACGLDAGQPGSDADCWNVNIDNGTISKSELTIGLQDEINGKANVGDSYTKAEQDAIDTAQDAAIGTKADTSYVDSENADQDAVIATKADKSYVDSENAAQDSVIDTKADKTYVDSENASQQSQIDQNAGDISDNASNIADNAAKNDEQDDAIEANEVGIATNSNAIQANADDIGSLETVAANHEARLNSHDALLSKHSDKLEDHSKGLAIAMSMPDAWLSDSKSFGIFGSVGGFDGETAVGFAAIGRIDQTFSLNAKLGADTSFEQFGWQAGFGAQW